jgi:hypothetical protein
MFTKKRRIDSREETQEAQKENREENRHEWVSVSGKQFYLDFIFSFLRILCLFAANESK